MLIKLFKDETDDQLNLLFDHLNEKHFNKMISKIPCSWNKRLATTAGICRFMNNRLTGNCTPTKIELAYRLFKNEEWDKDKIVKTMLHEMVHAFLLEHYNEKGHTVRFQTMMSEITGVYENHRCHNYNTDGLKRTRKVELVCPTHGVVHKMTRAPRVSYICRKCRSKLSVIKINKSNDGIIPLF